MGALLVSPTVVAPGETTDHSSRVTRGRRAINAFPSRVAAGDIGDRSLWLGWVATRAWGLAAVLLIFPYNNTWPVKVDIGLYWEWATHIWSGSVPYRDFTPDYPPGIMPFISLPIYSLAAYTAMFLLLAFTADLLIMNLLMKTHRSRGATIWVVAAVLLGPIMWTRFDVFVAAALVGAVVATERRRYWLAGSLIAFASLIKVWPLILVLVWFRLVPPGKRAGFVAITGGVVGAALLPVMALGGANGLWALLQEQGGRAVEIESVFAFPLYAINEFAHHLPIVQTIAFEFTGSAARTVSDIASMVFIVAIVALVVKALLNRAPRPTVTGWLLLVAAVLVATAKVLSPQYLVWVTAAVAMHLDATPRRKALSVALAATLIMTQVLYPFGLSYLLHDPWRAFVISGAHALTVVGFLVAACRASLVPEATVASALRGDRAMSPAR